MTTHTAGPLSRPVAVNRLPPEGTEVVVEASAEERAALARDFDLVSLDRLVGRFRLAGSTHRIAVTGTIEAEIVQTCVVTLEAFPSRVEEAVDVDFSDSDAFRHTDAEDAEMPDPIVDGLIDLGTLTAEFLALGLDPYPKKPGAAFAFEDEGAEAMKPFAALRGRSDRDG
jgi:hypothetical protein